MELSDDKSIEAAVIFNKYAHEYQGKFMDVSLYKGTLKTFCNFINKENAKVLDVACGPGNVTKYLLREKPNLIVLGIDLATNMISLARCNNPNATFKVMDCRSISSLTEKFDAVVSAFCLPYLSKEETHKLVNDISALLSDQGVCYISTMENDYNKSGYETGSKGDQIYMHYYEKDYLINVLTSCNFKIEEVSRIVSTMSNGKEVTDLIIISRKKNGL
ncbi:MAG: class I SAM-dependent methyltransferase [Bacteroidetes bacterium]|nr:MAG: class I SAM-dependent methyltransferase [Bacteroidota bacterium]